LRVVSIIIRISKTCFFSLSSFYTNTVHIPISAYDRVERKEILAQMGKKAWNTINHIQS